VYDYKDHGFVIDLKEAKEILRDKLIKTNTEELKFVEELYQLIELAGSWLGFVEKRLKIVGDCENTFVWDEK
jgi:hypothetical protein